ncbi:hypothetical protein D3C85_1191390 [compost metagenome]
MEGIKDGVLDVPSSREHLFKNLPAALDFCLAFNIQNFNVRTIWDVDGKPLIQVVYQTMEN